MICYVMSNGGEHSMEKAFALVTVRDINLLCQHYKTYAQIEGQTFGDSGLTTRDIELPLLSRNASSLMERRRLTKNDRNIH